MKKGGAYIVPGGMCRKGFKTIRLPRRYGSMCKVFLLQELLILSCLLTDDSSRGPFEYDVFHVDRDTAA